MADGIRISPCGHNISYVLDDDSLLYGTGYKVLQGQDQEYFIPCVKYSYNGKPKLTYLTRELRSLDSCLMELDASSFQKLFVSLLEAALDVRDNGFLSMGNIDFDLERIFVDAKSVQARIVYLPTTVPLSGADAQQTSAAICEMMRSSLERTPNVSRSFPQLTALLQRGEGDPGLLIRALKHEGAATGSMHVSGLAEDPNPTFEAPLQFGQGGPVAFMLETVTAQGPAAFRIFKPVTVVGKSAAKADCPIELSSAISRTHCSLRISGSDLYVTDLGSANGTFVNGIRLNPGAEISIEPGSHLRLANVDFVVSRAR